MKIELAAVVTLGLVVTAGLAAKGTTVTLVVSQGELRAPIEITASEDWERVVGSRVSGR
jgi:hypothetical protein